MSNECKCTHPDGGGMKCPSQHLAVCIRGRDKECYGDCIPIPSNYKIQTSDFSLWLIEMITQSVDQYAQEHYSKLITRFPLKRSSENLQGQGGRMTFRINNFVNIYVRFSYDLPEEGPEGLYQTFNVH